MISDLHWVAGHSLAYSDVVYEINDQCGFIFKYPSLVDLINSIIPNLY